jgi:L-iditol 2-dehydrogenase
MQGMMSAGVYHPGMGLKLEKRLIPKVGPGELQLRVHSVGICGSDIHYYKEGHIGSWKIERPHVLGHEFSGTVTALGEGVNDFELGERVSVEPCLPCGTCAACATGRYNVCQNLRFIGSPHTDGAFAEYLIVTPRFAHRLPPSLDFEMGALVEPTAVAVQAIRRSSLRLGETVAIVGAGPIGLLTLKVALASGASAVFVSDINQERLEMARQFGATAAIDARTGAVNTVMELTGGRGVDVAFEAVGSAATIDQAVAMTTPGGRLTVIGMSPQDVVPFNFFSLQAKELDLRSVWLYQDAFPPAIALLASGRVAAREIITHRFPFDQILTALEVASSGRDSSIKVMLQMQP